MEDPKGSLTLEGGTPEERGAVERFMETIKMNLRESADRGGVIREEFGAFEKRLMRTGMTNTVLSLLEGKSPTREAERMIASKDDEVEGTEVVVTVDNMKMTLVSNAISVRVLRHIGYNLLGYECGYCTRGMFTGIGAWAKPLPKAMTPFNIPVAKILRNQVSVRESGIERILNVIQTGPAPEALRVFLDNYSDALTAFDADGNLQPRTASGVITTPMQNQDDSGKLVKMNFFQVAVRTRRVAHLYHALTGKGNPEFRWQTSASSAEDGIYALSLDRNTVIRWMSPYVGKAIIEAMTLSMCGLRSSYSHTTPLLPVEVHQLTHLPVLDRVANHIVISGYAMDTVLLQKGLLSLDLPEFLTDLETLMGKLRGLEVDGKWKGVLKRTNKVSARALCETLGKSLAMMHLTGSLVPYSADPSEKGTSYNHYLRTIMETGCSLLYPGGTLTERTDVYELWSHTNREILDKPTIVAVHDKMYEEFNERLARTLGMQAEMGLDDEPTGIPPSASGATLKLKSRYTGDAYRGISSHLYPFSLGIVTVICPNFTTSNQKKADPRERIQAHDFMNHMGWIEKSGEISESVVGVSAEKPAAFFALCETLRAYGQCPPPPKERLEDPKGALEHRMSLIRSLQGCLLFSPERMKIEGGVLTCTHIVQKEFPPMSYEPNLDFFPSMFSSEPPKVPRKPVINPWNRR